MKLETQNIVLRLVDARKAYYNSDKPTMSDADFDMLEEQLHSLDPHHPYFSSVGISGEDGRAVKIRHQIPMLSMGKAKNLVEVQKWLSRLNLAPTVALTIQPKIDGLSASLFYLDGQLVYVATRGDGMIGQDISHISRYVDDIPASITFTRNPVEIRGELHLPRDTGYNTGGKSLRNNCVGLINRKNDRDSLHFVRFLAYQMVFPEERPGNGPVEATDKRFFSESGKIDILKTNGFYTFDTWRIAPDSGLEQTEADTIHQISGIYADYIDHIRDHWNFETDGLIIVVDDNHLHQSIDARWVVDHHHHYSLAFKPPSRTAQTTLKNILWQPGRQGNLTPVAVFMPVLIGGATLERASLHNADNVRRLKLSRDDYIVVERANDVIPYVRSNTSASSRNDDFLDEELWPKTCPSCGSAWVNRGVHIACLNPECRGRVLQSILFWVRQAEMEQVALKTLESLYDAGKLRTICDLYTLTAGDFTGMDGFGDKKITNFLRQVASAKKMNAVEIISRLGIPMVQKKTLSRLGIRTMEDFWAFKDESCVIGKRIVDWKSEPENLDFLTQLLAVVEIRKIDTADESQGGLCLTGEAPVSRKVLVAALENKGWTVSNSVTKETVKVLCDNPEGSSSKLKKARNAGIHIVLYQDFLEEEGMTSLLDHEVSM